MSWDVRVVPEAIIVHFVRCSTCGLNEECDSEADAEDRRKEHSRDHDDLWVDNDIGYSLNPERQQ